ncbi:Rib/alpha-like domain-containing protein [Streptococcus pyogenes]|uniref:Rib/alpha-like domain-containing protein n=1 Tax=Streptococcus pyogenes TaxID=1314 RepID=UPI003C6F1C58
MGNLSDLPKVLTVAFETPVDATTPGNKPTKVVVTYPDGSKEYCRFDDCGCRSTYRCR